jgi:hypothetical protein
MLQQRMLSSGRRTEKLLLQQRTCGLKVKCHVIRHKKNCEVRGSNDCQPPNVVRRPVPLIHNISHSHGKKQRERPQAPPDPAVIMPLLPRYNVSVHCAFGLQLFDVTHAGRSGYTAFKSLQHEAQHSCTLRYAHTWPICYMLPSEQCTKQSEPGEGELVHLYHVVHMLTSNKRVLWQSLHFSSYHAVLQQHNSVQRHSVAVLHMVACFRQRCSGAGAVDADSEAQIFRSVEPHAAHCHAFVSLQSAKNSGSCSRPAQVVRVSQSTSINCLLPACDKLFLHKWEGAAMLPSTSLKRNSLVYVR